MTTSTRVYAYGALAIGIALFSAAMLAEMVLSSHPMRREAWLLLLPFAYLVRFFRGLLRSRPAAAEVKRGESLPPAARRYVYGVIGAAVILWTLAAFEWQSENLARFFGYLLLAMIGATLKVRLPGMRGTISVSFVLLLVAIAELTLSEAIFVGALSSVVQCLWKPKKAPSAIRTLFNGACLSVSTLAAFAICRWLLARWLASSLIGFLVVSTVVLYTVNTYMVATVLCLVEAKPLRSIWQNCRFWSSAYYLVGAAAAGLMIETCRLAGWQPSLLVLPVMGLVYISYRLHISPIESAALGQ